MNFLRIAWRDIQSILKNRFIRVSVVAIIIVPLLYSLLYLAAFWDPYSKLQKVPVAVVNLDKGAQNDNENVNYGEKIVSKLKNNNELGWRFTSEKEADSGTKGDKYYAEFIIPEDFSEKIISAKNNKPEQAKIYYKDNEKRNFLASQINSKVEIVLKDQIAKDITSEYTKVAFDNLYDIKDGFKQASDGSGKIKDGLSTASNGSEALNDGIGDLKNELPDIKNGTQQLYDGSSKIEAAVNNGTFDKNGNPLGLKNGAYELRNGINEAYSGVYEANNEISNGIANLGNQKSLFALVNGQNAKTLRNIMGDSSALTDIDMSPLMSILPNLNSQSIGTILKTTSDFNAIDFNSISSMPELSSFLTNENINNINCLLGDTSALGQVDMSKLSPIQAFISNSSQLNRLLNEALTLGKMDMSSISTLKPILSTTNSTKFNQLLQEAQENLGGSSGDEKINFIKGQEQVSDTYVKTANQLNLAYDQLNSDLKSPYLTDDEKIAAMKKLLDNYNSLTIQTSSNMNNSKSKLKEMTNSLISMKTLIDTNGNLISETKAALTPSNINSINTMLLGLESVKADFNSKESQEAISSVQNAMVPANITYIQNLMSQLTKMKNDLDNNKTNLDALQKLLIAVQKEGGAKEALNKIIVLQEDIKASQPMLQSLNAALSNPVVEGQIENAPQILGQITRIQKEIKDNKELVGIAEDALNDGNIKMANNLIAQIPSMKGKMADLEAGMDKLDKGVYSMANSVETLGNGASSLKNGLYQLNSRVPSLNDGISKLYAGSSDLNNGIKSLYDGSDELNTKLKNGYDKINGNLVNTSSDMASFVSEPLTVKNSPIGEVKNYGTGFTPYFVPLSLWVGAIMMFFVITDKVDEDIQAGSRSLVAGKFLSYGFIGIFQAILVSVVVLTLGLKPKSLILYFLFNIFMSFVFIAIIQCLVFLMGQAGRLLSIALLILQLTSCAGTFPLEVVPKFFKIVNPFMPFTYCVSAIREIIAGIDYGVLFKDTIILAAVMFVFLAISMALKGHADKLQTIIKEKQENINF